MCLPKKFLNFGRPKIAVPFWGNVPETTNEERVKERLMMLVDLFSFKFRIWSLLLLLLLFFLWNWVIHSQTLKQFVLHIFDCKKGIAKQMKILKIIG